MVQGDKFNWIGISIDMKSLALVPNIQLTKEQNIYSLNINMQTKKSTLWLKRKLKSFLMNNVTIYFRSSITTKDFAQDTLNKIYEMATEKFVACCSEFKQFHQSAYRQVNCRSRQYVSHDGKRLKEISQRDHFILRLDLQIAKIIYVVIHSFFKYLVCHIKGGTVFADADYDWFFKHSLQVFQGRFVQERNKFPILCRILESKCRKIEHETLAFKINNVKA